MSDATTTWLDTAGRFPVLAEETVLLLARQIQDPEVTQNRKRRAIDKLVRHNMKLAASLTTAFIKRSTNLKLSDERVVDYLQQAALGLIRAAEKFEPKKGYKFSTYANTWVRHFLQRYHYNQWSIIRVPEEVVCLAVKHQDKPTNPTFRGRVADAVAARTMVDLDKPVKVNTETLSLGEVLEYGPPEFYKSHNGTNLNTMYSAEALLAYGGQVITDRQEIDFITWMEGNDYTDTERATIMKAIRRVKRKHHVS